MKPKNEEHLDEKEAVWVVGEGSSDVVTAKRPIFGFISIEIVNIWVGDLDKPTEILKILESIFNLTENDENKDQMQVEPVHQL